MLVVVFTLKLDRQILDNGPSTAFAVESTAGGSKASEAVMPNQQWSQSMEYFVTHLATFFSWRDWQWTVLNMEDITEVKIP